MNVLGGCKYNANKYGSYHDVGDITLKRWLVGTLIYGLVWLVLIVGMFIVVYLSKLLESPVT